MRIGRRNSLGRFSLASLVALAVAAGAGPSRASAAEVIGENGTVLGCGEGVSYVQAQEAPLTARYTPSTYGVITSWSAMADGTSDQTLQLLVLRPDPGAGANNFIAVQKDAVRTLTQLNTLNTFTGVRFPAEAGDRLGLYVPDNQPAGLGNCDIAGSGAPGNQLAWYPAEAPLGTSVDFGTSNTLQLNASAVVEPDADRDGFGDESQDQCPTNASIQGPCPPAFAPAAPRIIATTGKRAAAIKKCKKKYPGKANAKKRKKCIKKAKKLPV